MKYKFIDLFAGIGGFRLGFQNKGFECVYSSEINEHAQEMYYENFGEMPSGDITKINEKEIPDHDILCAGFPCQPFSIAGDKKGFEDTRGTLFFDIIRILKEKKPKAVVLENVKHFKNHDKGRTLKVVLNSLKEIGYTTNWQVLNAKDFGVPQNRERTIIVGFLDNKKFDFNLLKQSNKISLETILDDYSEDFEFLEENEYTLIDNYKEQNSGLIFIGYRNKKMRTKGVRPNTEHLSRVHKQPNRIYSSKGTHPTLSSQESSGRYFIYHENKVRKLTLKECYKLMGFPNNFKLVGNKANLYNRVGNSVVVPMIEAIAEVVKEYLEDNQKLLYKERKVNQQLTLFENNENYYNIPSVL